MKSFFDWVTSPSFDWEYKQLMLMAYFQKIEHSIQSMKLFPPVPNLKKNYNEALCLAMESGKLNESFPRDLAEINLSNKSLVYDQVHVEGEGMELVNALVQMSLPKFSNLLKEGLDKIELIKEQLQIFPIGLMPLYMDEGYVLLSLPSNNVLAFKYDIPVIQNSSSEENKSISLEYISGFETGIRTSYERIKGTLIKYRQELPNPATWVIETNAPVPLYEAIIPLAKSVMYEFVTAEKKKLP